MEFGGLAGIAVLVAGLSIILGGMLGRYLWPASRSSEAAALLAAQGEVARLAEECRGWRERAELRETESRQAATEAAVLRERESALSARIDQLVAERGEVQARLTAEFENIAHRILKTNAAELSTNSQQAVAALLGPLRERIQDFQNTVRTTYETERGEVLSLKEQIRHLVETSQAVGSQADGLAKALRGDSQMLGRWGELVLERILEAAGLREGIEFISQGRGLGLRSEAGGAQRPDYILLLPEQRTMIIDSKTPLASYERLVGAADDVERRASGAQFVKDVRGHIDDLSGKRYQDNDKLSAHECALMFIPIEGALAAALTWDPDLLTYAWSRRVVVVGPATLLMTARTVGSIWQNERQGQNTQEIARLAGVLCDKLSLSVEDLLTVGKRLADAAEAHNKALARLSSGRGNALSIGKSIRGLGVKTRRVTPEVAIDGVLVYAGDGDVPDDDERDAEIDLAAQG